MIASNRNRESMNLSNADGRFQSVNNADDSTGNRDEISNDDFDGKLVCDEDISIEKFRSTDSIKYILEKECDGEEIKILVLDLLIRCSHRAGSKKSCDIYFSVLQFSVEKLSTLLMQTSHTSETSEVAINLQKMFLSLVIISLKHVRKLPQTLEFVTCGGIVSNLLHAVRAIEFGLTKNENTASHNIEMLYGLMYAIFDLFYHTLVSDNISSSIVSYLKLYHFVISYESGQFINRIIAALVTPDKVLTQQRINAIANLFCSIISRMKILRLEMRAFIRDTNDSFHHDDKFGKNFSCAHMRANCDTEKNCAISTTFVILYKYAMEVADEEIFYLVLKNLSKSGGCCCLPKRFLLRSILIKIKDIPNIRGASFLFLKNTLYRDMGFYQNNRNNICVLCSSRLMILDNKLKAGDVSKDDDLCLFANVLNTSDTRLSQAILNHLVSNFFNFNIRYQRVILFGVIFPIYFEYGERSRTSNLDSDYTTSMILCLSLLRDIKTLIAFGSNLDALNVPQLITPLFCNEKFLPICCGILETRILHKLSKLESAKFFIPALNESCTVEIKILAREMNKYEKDIFKVLVFDSELSMKRDISFWMDANLRNVEFHSERECDNFLNSLNGLHLLSTTFKNILTRSEIVRNFLKSSTNDAYNFEGWLTLFLRLLSENTNENPKLADTYLNLIESFLTVSLILSENSAQIEKNFKTLLNVALRSRKVSARQVCDCLLSTSSNANKIHLVAIDDTCEPLVQSSSENFDDESDTDSSTSVDENMESKLRVNYESNLFVHSTLRTVAIDIINSAEKEDISDDTIFCLRHIVSACENNPKLCAELNNQKLATHILDKVKFIFEKSRLASRLLMELVAILFAQNTRPEEVKKYFELFKDKLFYDLLIIPLKMCATRRSFQPAFSLDFPQPCLPAPEVLDNASAILAISMRNYHKEVRIISAWSQCAFLIHLDPDLNWNFWSSGFAISTWLKLHANTFDTNNADGSFSERVSRKWSHLASVGCDSFLIELWIDTQNSCLQVRFTCPNGESFEIISEYIFENCLPKDRWFHFAFMAEEAKKASKLSIKITLFVDGGREIMKILPFNAIIMRKIKPYCLMMGDSENASQISYSMGNTTMFKSAFMTHCDSLSLIYLGPDIDNVIFHAQLRAFSNLSNNVKLTVNFQDIAEDILSHLKSFTPANIAENALISFSPKSFANFKIYRPPNIDNGSLVLPNYSNIWKQSKSDVRSYTLASENVILVANLEVTYCRTLETAIFEQGGSSFLLFLFAFAVENCRDEDIQADILDITIRYCFKDHRFRTQFEELGGFHLLSRVLISSRCIFGPKIFDAIFNFSCNQKKGGKRKKMNDWILVYPDFIIRLLLPAIKNWRDSDTDLLSLLCKHLCALIGSNRYADINQSQLERCNVVGEILSIFKYANVLGTGCDIFRNFKDSTSADIVEFIGKFARSSSDFSETIRVVINYLISAHPSSMTYVSKKFYFLSPASLKENTSLKMKSDEEITNFRNSFARNNEKSKHERSISLVNLNEKNYKYASKRHSLVADSWEDLLKTSENASSADFSEEGYYFQSSFVDIPKYDHSPARSVVSERTDFPDSENIVSQPVSNSNLEINSENIPKWSTKLAECLILMIQKIVLAIPEENNNYLTFEDFIFDSFLVLANHPEPRIRSAVLDVILIFQICAGEKINSKFVFDSYGYFHLANQISSHDATEELVNCCISLLANRKWNALSQLQQYGEISFPELNLNALPPLIALLPKTMRDISLTRKLLCVFNGILHNVPEALEKLIEYYFVETLIKTVKLFYHTESEISNFGALLKDIEDIFSSLAATCVERSGVRFLEIFTDMVHKCHYWKVSEEGICDSSSPCISIIYSIYCVLLRSAFNVICGSVDSFQTLQSSNASRRNSSSVSSTISTWSKLPSSFMSFSSSSDKKSPTKSELAELYKSVISKSVQYFLFHSNQIFIAKDAKFACFLFSTLINDIAKIATQRPLMRIGSSWNSIYWAAQDTLRYETAQLLIWMISPPRSITLRMFAITTLLSQIKAREVLASLLYVNAELEQYFASFLWHLMYSRAVQLSDSELDSCELLKSRIQSWEIVAPQAIGNAHDRWQFEVVSNMREIANAYWEMEKMQQPSVYKSVNRWSVLEKKISYFADSVTRRVVSKQDSERKIILASIKSKFRIAMEIKINWKNVIEIMTHELGPWFADEYNIRSWELDPTEGPHRVRKKLRRRLLDVDPKFFKQECMKYAGESYKSPLLYLYDDDEFDYKMSSSDYLPPDEKIIYTSSASIVEPDLEICGEILIWQNRMYFVSSRRQVCFAINSHNSRESLSSNDEIHTRAQSRNSECAIDNRNNSRASEQISHSMAFSSIKEIHNRRYQLKERAVEVFLTNGKTHLIAFNSETDRNKFATALNECDLPNRTTNDMLLSDTLILWKNNRITNWEYLMALNKLAGRTYNDLMQYIVTPFTLADYSSASIDLDDSRIYRNLKKTMAVQESWKENHFINYYNTLKNEFANGNTNDFTKRPYHYASNYSNTATVLHFLLRLPPYTKIFLNFQDDNFDLPDRTFHSMESTWRLISSQSRTDVKELVPEFYYLPEFLLNPNGFNFGKRQNGESVDNVKLPGWTNNDPRLFVLVNRQSLESDYARANLPHWIDLIFGYKQTGEPAVEAINVYHPATYSGYNAQLIKDEVERGAWETMIKMYGQIPRQLFKLPHPPSNFKYSKVQKESPVSVLPGKYSASRG